VVEPLDHLEEFVDSLEFPVDRGEAHVGHLVEIVEPPEDHLPELGARDLVGGLAEHGRLVLDLVHEVLDGKLGDRPLFQGPPDAAFELGPLEGFAPPSPLHDHQGFFLDALVAREAEAAGEALAAPADGLALGEGAGVDDLVVFAAAVGTTQDVPPDGMPAPPAAGQPSLRARKRQRGGREERVRQGTSFAPRPGFG